MWAANDVDSVNDIDRAHIRDHAAKRRRQNDRPGDADGGAGWNADRDAEMATLT